MTEFKLPNLGDGVAAGDVRRVLVKVGDTPAADQAVLELETRVTFGTRVAAE